MKKLWMPAEFEARFWGRVRKGQEKDACWEWQGAIDRYGYGTLYVRRGSVKGPRMRRGAHRIAALLMGVAPRNHARLMASHTCRNPACVNPDHIEWVPAQYRRSPRGSQHGGAKLNEDVVGAIRQEYRAHGLTMQALADKYDVCKSTISSIVNGVTWSHTAE